jgi:hypothetical protein
MANGLLCSAWVWSLRSQGVQLFFQGGTLISSKRMPVYHTRIAVVFLFILQEQDTLECVKCGSSLALVLVLTTKYCEATSRQQNTAWQQSTPCLFQLQGHMKLKEESAATCQKNTKSLQASKCHITTTTHWTNKMIRIYEGLHQAAIWLFSSSVQ